ncbi:MAG: 6-bladed beta-propeller [Bacteroidales bacterium]
MRKFIFPLLFALILSGCRHRDSNSQESLFTIIPIKAGTSIDTNLSEFASSIDYIRLETNPDCLVGSISRFVIFKDRIYMWDGRARATIFCFDIHGKFIYKIQRSGKGPGEYIGVYDMYIDERKEQIVLYDASQAKIIRYSINGEFVEEIQHILLPMAIAAYDSDSYWFYTMGSVKLAGITPLHNLLNVGKDGKTVLSSHFPFNPNLDNLLHRAFNNDNGYLTFCYSYCDTIYRIKNSEIHPFVFIDFNKSNLIKQLSRYSPAQKNERDQIINNKDFADINDVLVSDQYLFASYASSSFMSKVLYSFSTQKLFHIRNLVNDIDEVPFNFFPKKLSKGKAYLTINPLEIVELFSKNAKSGGKTIPKSLNDIKIDDNPIIAIIQLKDF